MREDAAGFRPRTSVELGLMKGAPPAPQRLVTSDNWIEAPFNRWGFVHVRELARTARIARGEGPQVELPYDLRDFGSVSFRFDGSTMPFAQALARTYTDAVCVVHHGRIVLEHY